MSANLPSLIWLVPCWAAIARPTHDPKDPDPLADGQRQPTENSSVEQALMRMLGFPNPQSSHIPAADYLYELDMLKPVPEHVICADPVHLRADRDHAVLVPPAALSIGAEEADAIIASLNELVAADAMVFERSRPGRWYLSGMCAQSLDTIPTHAVAHRNVGHYLPGGDDAADWRRLMTETQMLLHTHEINRRREQQGKLPINGIWFWGGAPCAAQSSKPAVQLHADDDFSRALATRLSIELHAPLSASQHVPVSADSLLHAIDAAHTSGTSMVVVDLSMQDAWLQGDMHAMASVRSRLEQVELPAIRQALSAGRLQRLVVDGCDGVAVHLSQPTPAPWWRRLFTARR